MSKFVIVCPARSGSTLLCGLMDQHPDIKCENEVFWGKNLKVPNSKTMAIKTLNTRKDIFSALAPHYGHKILLHQCDKFKDMNGFEDFVEKSFEDGWKLIFLNRRDIFSQVVSSEVGAARKLYTAKTEEMKKKKHKKVELDVERFKSQCIVYSDRDKKLKDTIKKYTPSCKSLVYEDNLLTPEAQQATSSMLYNFIGVSDYKLEESKKIIRLSSGNLADDVSNFDEILFAYNQIQEENL